MDLRLIQTTILLLPQSVVVFVGFLFGGVFLVCFF